MTESIYPALEDLYGVTPMQEGMLFHALHDARGEPYVVQYLLALRGRVDEAALRRAWTHAVERHAVLRSGFAWNGGAPRQEVHRAAELPWQALDWREVPPAEHPERLEALLAADRARGFDPARPPLVRATLVRVADDAWKLAWIHHHLVLDGWSAAQVLGEVLALHAAEAAGRPAALPARRPFAEYVAWAAARGMDAAEAFWRAELNGFAAPTPLPAGRGDGAGFGAEDLRLSAVLTARLRSAAREHGLTLNTVVQGAWALLLARHAGTDDVVFGAAGAGRPAELEGAEAMVGLFIQTQPVRATLRPGVPAAEWMRAMQARATAAREHEHAPLAQVQRWSGAAPGTPLFETLLAFENYPVDEALAAESGVEVELEDVVSWTHYPLTLTAIPGARLALRLKHDRARMDGAGAARLLAHLRTLLEGIAADPLVPVASFSPLDADERDRVVLGPNATARAFPAATFPALFGAQARRTPNALAVSDGRERLTYAELADRAGRVAGVLRARGVGREMRVGVCLGRSVDGVAAILGVLRAGAAYVPVDPAYPAERIGYVLRDAGASVVLAHAARVPAVPPEVEVVCVDRLGPGADAPAWDHVDPATLAYVLYTSGSTGLPKGVLVEHRSVANLAFALREAIPGQGDAPRVSMNGPVTFDTSVKQLVRLAFGASLHLVPEDARADGAALSAWLRESAVDLLDCTPGQLRMLRAEGGMDGPADVLVAGEAIDPALWADLAADGARRYHNLYGPTECTVDVTAARVAGRAPVLGGPLANVRAYVLDGWMHPAPEGAPGELFVGGAGVARGYLGRPALTAERFVPDPFGGEPGARLYRTGDRVRRGGDGALAFLGRVDDQVKVRGFRVEPGEVAAALRQHPSVRDAAVVAVEHAPGDVRLAAYVVAGAAAAELRAWLRGRVPEHMVPAAFVPMDALPLTAHGKLDRRALPAPDGAADTEAGYIAPRTPAEEVLCALWAEVLGAPRVGVEDDFFALGGHSLLAARVIARVREAFGAEVPLRALLEARTVAGLAASMGGAGAALPPVVPVGRDGPLPLSFAQQRLWFLHQRDPESPAYNVASGFRLRGALDVDAFGRALDALAGRHEALRTTFPAHGGVPVQSVAPRGNIPLSVSDLRHLPGAEREARVLRTLAGEAARPFDLAAGPLVRLSLLRTGAEEWAILFAAHHVVMDGWSSEVLARELAALYDACASGAAPALAPLPVQYADFAAWQREQLSAPVLAGQLAWWRARLDGAPPLLELPADHPRPAVAGTRGASCPFTVPAPVADALRQLGRREGATLFMTVLAALHALLGRVSGADDVSVGTPVAGRGRLETEGLIGFFANTLVLRADLSGDPPFRRLLARVREAALGAYAHQDVPFEKLVDEMGVERTLAHAPLFQVMLSLRRPPAAVVLGGAPLEPLPAPAPAAKFDLSWEVDDAPGDLPCRLEYRADLFGAATAERMAAWLGRTLAAVAADPDLPLSRIPLLDAAERAVLAGVWSGAPAPGPAGCIHHRFEQRAHAAPGAVAVAFCGGTLTYRALDRRANGLARRLRGHGVERGSVVGVCLERGPEMVIAVLAVLKAGAAYLPLDPEYPAERLDYMLADSGAAVLLSRGAPGGGAVPVLRVDAAAQAEDAEAPVTGAGPDDLAYVIYTSGSTGRPKGVAVTHGALLNHTRWMQDAFPLGPGDRVLQKTPFSFDASVWEFHAPLTAGATLVMAEPGAHRDPARLLAAVRDGGITVLQVVPPLLAALLDEPDAGPACAGLRRLFCGGEALPAALADRWRAASAAELCNLYGPTEACIDATFHLHREPAAGLTVPIGRPVAGVRCYVLDVAGEPAPLGVPGELFVGGRGVARGYLRRPGATAASFVPDPFAGVPGARMYRTGDRVRWLDGGVLEFMGRLDAQVKLRGFRIEPGEVEAVLLRHPGVARAAVVLRGGAGAPARLVGYVSPRDEGGDDALVDRALAWLAERLPAYMVPAALVVSSALPLTPSGKLDRRRLPDPAPPAPRDGTAPRTPAEAALAGVWADLLGVDTPDVHANFFALGGDSLLSIQAVSRARAAGWRVSVRQLFEHPTVAALARAAVPVDGGAGEGDGPAGDLPLTPIQRTFLDHPVAARHHWNQSVLLAPRRPLDPALLARALAALAEHHPALRLRVRQEGGGWTQHLAPAGAAVPLDTDDLSDIPGDALAAAVEARAARLQAGLDLAHGPVVRAAYLALGQGRGARLFITIHHLAVDGVSWRILADDLQAAYGHLERGEPVSLPARTTPPAAWAARLAARAAAGGFDGELPFWTDAARAAVPPFPADHAGAAGTEAGVRTAAVELDGDETAALLRGAAAWHAGVDEVLLAAVVRAAAGVSGEARLLVDVEGHGREDLFDDVDLSRSVGWFTSLAPVVLDLRGAAAPGAALAAVKAQLRAAPLRGVGHGALRWFHPDAGVRDALAAVRPRVRFEYLGQMDAGLAPGGLFAPAPEGRGPERDPGSPRMHPVVVGGAVLGGRLRVTWSCDGAAYEEDTVRGLAARFGEALRGLLAHLAAGEGGPAEASDFPLAGLDDDGVARLLEGEHGVEDVYPLTPAQEGILFHALHDGGGTYLSQAAVELTGPLDPDALARAWQAAVDRHAALRTGFAWERDDRALQVVRRRVDVPFARHDWRGADDAQARLAALLREDRERGLDPAVPPLLRLALVRLDEHEWRLLLTTHHLVLDGWSLPLLFHDVAALYAGFAAGRGPGLAPARPFRDFVAWLGRRDAARAEAFWRAELAGLAGPTVLPLPAGDGGGPADGEPDTAEVRLHGDETAVLRAFARAHGLTLHTLVQGAWGLLLARYTGDDEVVTGTTLSGRPADLPGAAETVGLFINTLPVRMRVPAGERVLPWLRALQDAQGRLREVEWSPLSAVRRWSPLGPGERLFEHLLVFENYPLGEALDALEGGVAVRMGAETERNSYPLTVVALPGESLALRARWDPCRFAAAGVERMLGHLRTLLRELAADPGRRLDDVPLASAAERAALADLGRTEPVDPGPPLHERFAARAALAPGAVAVSYPGGSLTYGALDARANRLAHRLRRHGVGPEVRVGLAMERGPEMVVGILAVLKAGGAYVPLDPAYPAERIAYLVADARIPVLLTTRALRATVAAPGAAVLLADDDGDEPGTAPPAAVDAGGLAYVIYTSGSTGLPKGVMVTHGQVGRLMNATERAFGFGPADVWTLFHSYAFDFSVWEIWGALLYGGRLVVVPWSTSRSPEAFHALLADEGVTVLNQTPSAFRALVAADAAAPAGRALALRTVVFGGEVLEPGWLEPWVRRHGDARPVLVNMYGITETTVHVTLRRITAADVRRGAASPVGVPLADLSAHLLDGAGRPVPAGVPGEIHVGGAGVARGYLGRPALTAERFLPDPFSGVPGARMYRSGDRAVRTGDGGLEFLGRADQQVKVRGFRIEPGEVEAALRAHPGVADGVVVVREDAPGDRRLVAYVVPAPGGAPAAAELREHARRRLPDHMVPAAFVAVPALPLTPNGKLDRRALPAPEPAPADAAGHAPPATPAEAALARVWSRVLRVERVGRDDDFFLLGGDSILALQVVSGARREGLRLSPRDVFENPTLAGLAGAVRDAAPADAGGVAAAPLDPAELARVLEGQRGVDDVYPLAPLQEGLLAHLLQAPSGRGDYVTQVAFDVDGPLDEPAFRRAWQAVLDRHDALRAAFVWEGDRPLQAIRGDAVLPLAWHDWRGVGDGEARFAAWRADDRRAGFDPARAPLMRVTVFRTGNEAHRVAWTHHHILLDGWSAARVLAEVARAYAAFAAGREPALAPVRPFRDYVDWTRRRDPAAEEAYWRAALEGVEAPTPLGMDRAGAGAEPAYGREVLAFSPGEAAGLAAGARRLGVTPNTLVQGAWALLLSRLAGRDDVVFGATVSGRPAELEGAEDMVGLFINTLPVRVRVPDAGRAGPWLAALQRAGTALREHEHTPLSRVQRWSGVPAAAPLFESVLVFENYPVHQALAGLQGLAVKPLPVAEQPHTALSLVADLGRGASIQAYHRADRLDSAAVRALLGHLRHVLLALAADADAPLGSIGLADEDAPVRFGAPAPDEALTESIPALFHAQARRTPGAVALRRGGEVLTYAALDRRANQLARRLRAAGVGPDDRVGVCLPRSPGLVVALLAILKAGGAYVALDPGLPRPRLAWMLADAGARAVVADAEHADLLSSPSALVLADDPSLADEPADSVDAGAGPENLAYVSYTSGSTGTPKGVLVPHRAVVRLVRGDCCDFGPHHTFLLLAPVAFDASTLELWGPLLNGGTLAVAPAGALSPEELEHTVRAEGVTTLWLTAGFFHLVADARMDALRGVRQLLAGGDVLSPAHVRRVLEAVPGITLTNGYGPTENTTFTCCHRMASPAAAQAPVPLGRPVAGTGVAVLDGRMRPVPAGVPGELYASGAGVARGYLGRPALTAAAFVPDPAGGGARLYRTGDRVRWRGDGTLEFLGRVDQQVKVRGFRVEPGEVEHALAAHPAVRDAAVAAREDAPGQKRLVAYVVPRPGHDADGGALLAWLRERLPEPLVPSFVVRMEALPLTANGKVDRRALPAPEPAAGDGEGYAAPRTPAEQALAEIWAGVLGVERVGVDDGFFALGGDSILSFQVVSRARRAGLPITARQLYENPTVAGLARAAARAAETTAEQGRVTGAAPLTPIQHWFFELDVARRHHWNQALLLRPRHPVDPACLRAALDHLLAHHDALRLRFAPAADGWSQRFADDGTVPVHHADLSALAPARRAREMEDACAGVQAGMDLERGPLFRAALFDLGGGGQRVLLAAHHLVVDGVSWRVLLEDLEAALDAAAGGRAPRLPAKTTSFRQWAERLAEHAASPALAAEAEYWTSALPPYGPALPVDHAGGENRVDTAGEVTAALDEAATRALLQEVPSVYRTRVDEALLAALARAFAGWTGDGRLLVDLEGHGREDLFADVDLSRTVGWFTSIHPVLLDVRGAADEGGALRAVKEQLRAVPGRGVGYGVLRWLSPDPEVRAALRALPAPDVAFNYLGQADASVSDAAAFARAPEPAGPTSHPAHGRRPHLLEVNAIVQDGALHCHWSYSRAVHRPETVERLALAFVDELRALVEHCRGGGAGGYTPSDFALAGLDADTLAMLETDLLLEE